MSFEKTFADFSTLVSDELVKRGEDLYEAIKEESKEAAEKVKSYIGKISEILARLADKKDKKMDKKAAEMAIRGYRQAIRSRCKSLENFVKWEAYKSFWDYVKSIVGAVVSLLMFSS